MAPTRPSSAAQLPIPLIGKPDTGPPVHCGLWRRSDPLRLNRNDNSAEDRLRRWASLRRLWAVQMIAHSARTFSKPRSRNWRNPRACLICQFVQTLAIGTCVAAGLDLRPHDFDPRRRVAARRPLRRSGRRRHPHLDATSNRVPRPAGCHIAIDFARISSASRLASEQ
jgi:hypothetical protein